MERNDQPSGPWPIHKDATPSHQDVPPISEKNTTSGGCASFGFLKQMSTPPLRRSTSGIRDAVGGPAARRPVHKKAPPAGWLTRLDEMIGDPITSLRPGWVRWQGLHSGSRMRRAGLRHRRRGRFGWSSWLVWFGCVGLVSGDTRSDSVEEMIPLPGPN